MGDLCLPNPVSGPSRAFGGTVDLLREDCRFERRFCLLLLSILLALVILSASCFFFLPANPPDRDDDSGRPYRGSFVGAAFMFLIASLRMWPVIGRCRIRIAELQGAAYAVQLLADQRVQGIPVSRKEVRQVLENAHKLARVRGHRLDGEEIRGLLEVLARMLPPWGSKRNEPSPAQAPA